MSTNKYRLTYEIYMREIIAYQLQLVEHVLKEKTDKLLETFDFEIKINVRSVPWEEIKPLKCQVYDEDEDAAIKQIVRFARALSRGHRQEVRWNHKGSPMGHYVKV